jgi:hypothetical protein
LFVLNGEVQKEQSAESLKPQTLVLGGEPEVDAVDVAEGRGSCVCVVGAMDRRMMYFKI